MKESPVDKARYLVEALEGRSVSELAAAHGVHRSWIYKLAARYRSGGYEALEPRSRAPRSCPQQTPVDVVEAIVCAARAAGERRPRLRSARQSPTTSPSSWTVPSLSTIWRVLKREGLVAPAPEAATLILIRFQAELPNEMWQADVTHWQLCGAEHAEILNVIDDHSRLFLASAAFTRSRPPMWWTSSQGAAGCTERPRACSVTTAPSSAPPHAAARWPCNQSSSGLGSPPRTRGPITRRPVARSSAPTRR